MKLGIGLNSALGGAGNAPVYKTLLDGLDLSGEFKAVSMARRVVPGYDGPLFQLKKDGGGTFDVGFTKKNLADIAAAAAWVGTDTAILNGFYFQDGSGDIALPPSDAEAPRVFHHGMMHQINGRVAGYYGIRNGWDYNNVLVVPHDSSWETAGDYFQLVVAANEFTDGYHTYVHKGNEGQDQGRTMALTPSVHELHCRAYGAAVGVSKSNVAGDARPIVYGHDYTPGNNTQRIHINGVQVAEGYAPAPAANTNDILFGRFYTHRGWISEYFWGSNRALMAAIATNANTFYGVTNWGKVEIHCIGNSITYGQGTTDLGGMDRKISPNTYPGHISSCVPEMWKVVNDGVNGQSMDQMIAAFDDLKVTFDLAKERIVCVFFEGHNSFYIDGQSAAQVYAKMETYAGLLRAYSSKIRIVACSPIDITAGGEGSNPGTRAKILALKDLIAASTFADVKVDLVAALDRTDATLWNDGVHPNDKGAGQLARYLMPYIQTAATMA